MALDSLVVSWLVGKPVKTSNFLSMFLPVLRGLNALFEVEVRVHIKNNVFTIKCTLSKGSIMATQNKCSVY